VSRSIITTGVVVHAPRLHARTIARALGLPARADLVTRPPGMPGSARVEISLPGRWEREEILCWAQRVCDAEPRIERLDVLPVRPERPIAMMTVQQCPLRALAQAAE
jgi:hypothetical protein